MTIYPYASGDLVETPNTYYYSEFHGRDFVAAWRQSRTEVLAKLPAAVPPAPVRSADPGSHQSEDLLEQALGGDDSLREAFIKKFEIHKRVHAGYNETFRALDKEARRSWPLYLRAADLFHAAYDDGHALHHLNVYLKCLDTLSAASDELSIDLAARLAWHLHREREFIEALIAERGISL